MRGTEKGVLGVGNSMCKAMGWGWGGERKHSTSERVK